MLILKACAYIQDAEVLAQEGPPALIDEGCLCLKGA